MTCGQQTHNSSTYMHYTDSASIKCFGLLKAPTAVSAAHIPGNGLLSGVVSNTSDMPKLSFLAYSRLKPNSAVPSTSSSFDDLALAWINS